MKMEINLEKRVKLRDQNPNAIKMKLNQNSQWFKEGHATGTIPPQFYHNLSFRGNS